MAEIQTQNTTTTAATTIASKPKTSGLTIRSPPTTRSNGKNASRRSPTRRAESSSSRKMSKSRKTGR